MQSVRSQVSGQPQHHASARARDLSNAVGPGRLRAVIRLPDLKTGNSVEEVEEEASPAEAEEAVLAAEEAVIPAQEAVLPAEEAVIRPKEAVLPEKLPPQSEPSPEIDPPCPPAADAAPATEVPAMLTATRTEQSQAQPAPVAPKTPSPGVLGGAWQLICRGHAFLMQPKIWLACVLSCMGFIVIAFYLQPRAQPEPTTHAERALPRPPEPEPEPEANPATQIVAPPAEISANSPGPHGLGLNPSGGFIPPLGEAPGANQANASQAPDSENIRMAADPRTGGGSRYNGQTAAEPAGARINDVAPLEVSEDLNQEGGTLR